MKLNLSVSLKRSLLVIDVLNYYRIELDNGGVKSREIRFDRNWTGKIGLYLAHSSAWSILESVC